jgi:hypothetical protein
LVVSGDLSQQLRNSTVGGGTVLEIAPLSEFRLS